MMTDGRGRGPWRSVFGGIRTRVVVWFVALFAILLVIGLVTVRQVLLVSLDEETDALLAQEVEELRLLAGGVDPATGEPFGADTTALFDAFFSRNVPGEREVLYGVVAGEIYASVPEPLAEEVADPALVTDWEAAPGSTWGESETDAGALRWLSVPLEGTDDRFVVASLVGAERAEIASSIQVMAIVSAGVLVVAAALGWASAGRLLAPIRRVTSTARSITESDLTARIPVEGSDEVAELTRTFNEMLDRLDDAFTTQRQFLDDVGHELRTPITIVRGHLELLPTDPAERQDAIHLCLDELDRMGRYVSDLLLLAKAQQPHFLDVHPVDVAELTDGLEPRARAIESDRRWRIDHLAPVSVVADADRVNQAMVNLLTNAVQHTGPGDSIGIGSRADDGEVRLWVADSGVGVDADERERIFERFGRGGDRTTRRAEGAGLGLAIVATIAEAHGGRVELDSEPGEGATFTLVLPRHPEDESEDL